MKKYSFQYFYCPGRKFSKLFETTAPQPMSTLEIIATLLSLIYIVLAVNNKSICFVFGIFASLVWGYVSLFSYNLLFDAILQIFYVGMSVYGLYLWRSDRDQSEELPITHMTYNDHWITIGSGVVLGLGVAIITSFFFKFSWPYLDSLTTAFLMMATYYLVKRKIECWTYFVIADAIYIYIYWAQGATLFAGMMIVYTIMAVVGYWQWGREMKRKIKY